MKNRNEKSPKSMKTAKLVRKQSYLLRIVIKIAIRIVIRIVCIIPKKKVMLLEVTKLLPTHSCLRKAKFNLKDILDQNF